MSSSPVLVDRAQREEIKTNLDESFLVEAAASARPSVFVCETTRSHGTCRTRSARVALNPLRTRWPTVNAAANLQKFHATAASRKA